MQLIMSLTLMIRTHEESETKSRRVKDSIKIKCKAWVSTKESGFIRNGTFSIVFIKHAFNT